MDAPSASPSMRVGLYFGRSQVRVLRELVKQLGTMGQEDFDVGLFQKALESAERDEPLDVWCSTPEEAEQLADGFTLWGIKRPAIQYPT